MAQSGHEHKSIGTTLTGKFRTQTSLSPGDHLTVRTCPGCHNWQVDYDSEAMSQFVQFRQLESASAPQERGGPFSLRRILDDMGLTIDLSGWYDALEDCFAEHAKQCAPLRTLMHKALEAGRR